MLNVIFNTNSVYTRIYICGVAERDKFNRSLLTAGSFIFADAATTGGTKARFGAVSTAIY